MKNKHLLAMVKLAMLVALLMIFCFTSIGFLKIGIVEITFNMIPVVIGAIAIGPAAGAFLGALFGAASFWQCFGQSTFGTLLFGVNPFFTVLICFVPRILAGLIPGLIFRAMTKKKDNIAAYFVSAAVGSLTNTVLFVGGFCLLFKDTMLGMASDNGLSPLAFIATAFLLNAAVELVANTAIVAAVSKAVTKAEKSKSKEYTK
ncbi:MAG: ECF transporter S component [Eubacteriales bacterium]|nr:ECF transporter S component [Eubacterium sp.]MDD7179694.1 ECF transporter S component [Eubacterium sp.]MDY5493340.1 ECF transporter S component [Eubacteriales bacterium]